MHHLTLAVLSTTLLASGGLAAPLPNANATTPDDAVARRQLRSVRLDTQFGHLAAPMGTPDQWLDLSSRVTSQSSTGWNGHAARAIDGNPDTNYGAGSCTHTNHDNSPWWQIRLAGETTVYAVKVTNRGDCCGGRLNGLEVTVNGQLCASGVSFSQGETKEITCTAPVTGTDVRLEIPGRREYLTLCEVEVRGAQRDTIEELNGPTAVALNRGQSPGREWQVRLGAHRFKVSIEDSTGMTLSDVSARIERVPAMYRRAFEIVSESGKNGVAFYSDLGGGAAGHGGQAYINLIPTVGTDVITHEAGHAFEQRATSSESDVPQRWQDAIAADGVSVSGYGDGAWWEDEAEFAKVYAWCYDAGAVELAELRSASPARFDLFERILELSRALGFECDESTITGVGYSQQTVCGSVVEVLEECQAECDRIGCAAFFYQEHPNNAGCPSSPSGGYQICGFTTAVDFGTTRHGHRSGSQVCRNLPLVGPGLV